MGLQLVIGPAGSGKTKYLYDEIIRQAGENPDTSYYFIVPEQFSIKTQYDLVKAHPAGGIMNIDVTSLARLANETFQKLPGIEHMFLPEIGKSMIIKKVLNELKDKLSLYRRNAGQAGFVAEIKALISELYQYSVTEEVLDKAIDDADEGSILKKKLTDALYIYSGFRSKLGDGLLTNEGLYDAFADIAESNPVFDDSVVVFDGFTGFTPSQYRLLCTILKRAKQVYVSFTADKEKMTGAINEINKYDLFYMSRKSADKMRELALSVDCEVLDNVYTDYECHKSEELKAISGSIYRNGSYDGCTSDVMLYSAADVQEEARFIATKIEKLLREDNYRYRDIGVVCPLETYGEAIANELEKIGAKYFIDRKKSLFENECSGYLMTVLKFMEKGFDTNVLIAFAKSGLSPIDKDDACVLEDYCIAMGIRGSAFKKPFTKEFYGRHDIPLERVEKVREKIMSELNLLKVPKMATGLEFTEKLYRFFEKTGLADRLSERAEFFENAGDRLRAKEYRKIYGEMIEIFDELVCFLGDEMMSAKEYREIMEAGLSEARVGLVPEGSEQIIIGDIERTRLKDIKVLFLAGANDGKLPPAKSVRGLITESDRNELSKLGMELSPFGLKKAGNDRFYVYLSLAKPSEKLYISWAHSDGNNDSLRPSGVVNSIKNILKNLKISTRDDLPDDERILLNDLGRLEKLKEIREYYAKHPEEKPKTLVRIKEENVSALYGEKLNASISKLETYAACPFEFFLKYGLKISERDEYELSPIDFGNVSHEALQMYSDELKERNLGWNSISSEERESLIEKCAKEALDKCREGIFKDSEKNKYIASRVTEMLGFTVSVLTKQLENTEFVPYEFEREFSYENEFMKVKGKIDRIDVANGTVKAVKVIDYKSSDRKIELGKVYEGLSLQLPVYLSEAVKIVSATEHSEYKPAAMLYNMIQNPFTELKVLAEDRKSFDEKAVIEKSEQAKIGNMRTKGLVNASRDIVKALDTNFIPVDNNPLNRHSSISIPVSTDKDGRFKSIKSLLSEENMNLVMNYVDSKTKEQARNIMNGDVRISPTGTDNCGCTYCDYRAVCGFDIKNGGKKRIAKKMDDEEVLFRMKGENTENG